MTTPQTSCRVCGGVVEEYVDLGPQPLSDTFVRPGADPSAEFFFPLVAGRCEGCTMVQLMHEVPRERMFNEDYPYVSSGSSVMREHFGDLARSMIAGELRADDPFVVEIGCNDGVMLSTVAEAGIRHLGLEPSSSVARMAAARGVRVRESFFDRETAEAIRADDGAADLVYAANTICHIPYLGSVLEGVRSLLAPDGVFVFEDPYLGDILQRTSFDQIYDEHFFLFSARSVGEAAHRFGLELVDVERLSVHGGEVRYTLALPGARPATPAVAELLAREEADQVTSPARLRAFAADVERIRDDLRALLERLKEEGCRVVGYGATAKSATVTNYCGLTPDLVEYVADTTPAKIGRLTPGAHLPVRSHAEFAENPPDYALLFAWNHAEEILRKEAAYSAAGGRWITYVPAVGLLDPGRVAVGAGADGGAGR